MEEILWTDARIRWMSDASKKSRFFYEIAERISAYLPPSARVFNAGGGLGDLASWISYHVEQVTIIANDPKAVAALRARCPHNVVAILGDVLTYAPDRLYDALVLYDIGGAEQVMPVVHELSRAKTFVLMPRDNAQQETLITGLIDALGGAGIPYSYETMELEHVQPFCSRGEARAYFDFYEKRNVSEEALDEMLEPADDEKLPFLHREIKKLGMVMFNAANPALKKPIL